MIAEPEEVVEGKFALLAGCYAFLALLAVCLLVFVFYSPHSAIDATGLAAENSSSSLQFLANAKVAVLLLQDQMHNTWFFLYIFLAVWVTVLGWEVVVRRRLELPSGLREFYFMGWITLATLSMAIIYGMATNGILAYRFPMASPAADVLAVGFVLALPVIAWTRLLRQRKEQDEIEDKPSPYRRVHSSLGLFDEESSARLLEKPEVKEVAVTEVPFELRLVKTEASSAHAIAAADRLIESAEMPAKASSLEMVSRSKEMDSVQGDAAGAKAQEKGIDGFRDHLSTLNHSWAGIERTRHEIDQWFEQQRQRALAHLEQHPGMRAEQVPLNLSGEFLNERLGTVDAEWAKIRQSALEICRWFGDLPAEDRNRQR